MKVGEQLYVTPHTISGQVGTLENVLGTPLCGKRGRNIELTEAGKLAFGYAEDMFVLGSDPEESLRKLPGGRSSYWVPRRCSRRRAEDDRLSPNRTGNGSARARAHRMP